MKRDEIIQILCALDNSQFRLNLRYDAASATDQRVRLMNRKSSGKVRSAHNNTCSPKVSVCIPLFNHARFLPEAIESVLAQTFRDFEIIVVDDGSEDDGLQIARAYATKYPNRIRVFTHASNENRGISETINLALEKSAGVYVCGLAPDDLLSPDKLEKQVAFLDLNPQIKWVYAQACCVDENNLVLEGLTLFGADLAKEVDPLESLIRTNVIPGMTVLCRRQFMLEVGSHERGLLYSDWDIWVRALAKSEAAFLPYLVARYRIHGTNTSVGVEARTNMERGLAVMRSLRKRAETATDRLGEPRILATLDLQIAFYLYHLGEEKGAAASLDRAYVDDASFIRDSAFLGRWLRWLIFYTQDAVLTPGFLYWLSERATTLRKRASKKILAARHAAEIRAGLSGRQTLRSAFNCLINDPTWFAEPWMRRVAVKSLLGNCFSEAARHLLRKVLDSGGVREGEAGTGPGNGATREREDETFLALLDFTRSKNVSGVGKALGMPQPPGRSGLDSPASSHPGIDAGTT
jgi:glycosyltransferase involved in cell wall biosynthesis